MSRDDETAELGPTCPTCGRDLPEPGSPCPECTATEVGGTPSGSAGFTGPRRVAGYEILGEIGSGGMGTVFEAHDEEMRRKVALKVLSRHHAPSEKIGKRFEQEAWIGGKLDHPNLVKVYDRGEWEELSYYSMELVEGGSLHDVTRNMKRWGRDDRVGLSYGSREYVEWAIRRVIETAEGLEYAHRHGVVHRDIKPMNILLSSELGTVKIADFGLAIDEEATRMTTAGKILGTLAYMAPEQLLGRQSEIGPATDVYALGVTLFELLTLEYPYTGETQQLYLNAVLTSAARRPSKLNERVSRDLEVVIGKALEKAPADRYASAADLAADLENVLRFRPISAKPPRWPERIAKWARRKPVHAALLATLIVAAPLTAFLTHRTLEHRRLVRAERLEDFQAKMRLLSQRNEYEEILKLGGEMLRVDPDNQYALRSRVLSFIGLAQRMNAEDEAFEALERGCVRDLDRLLALGPQSSSTHTLRAFAFEQLGHLEEATEARLLAERHRSDEPDDDELHFEAMLEARRGNHDRAVELFSLLIGRRPNRTMAVLYRGMSYDLLGRTEKAVEDFRLVATIDPDDPFARLNLWRLLSRTGRFEEGRGHLQAVRRLLPEHPIIHQGLADDALKLGREARSKGETEQAATHFGAAEAAARRSLELDDALPWTHVNLGASLGEQYRLGDGSRGELMDEAIEHYERAVSLCLETGAEPDAYLGANVNLCDAYLQLGKLERGLDVCARAAELESSNPLNFYNLAGAYALAGRADEAFSALERNFELGDRDHGYLATDPWFESLRDDPRFAGLIERMRRDEG